MARCCIWIWLALGLRDIPRVWDARPYPPTEAPGRRLLPTMSPGSCTWMVTCCGCDCCCCRARHVSPMAGGGEQLPDCGKIVLWDGIPWNWDWEAAPTRNKGPQHPCQPRARLRSEICSIPPEVLDRAGINLV